MTSILKIGVISIRMALTAIAVFIACGLLLNARAFFGAFLSPSIPGPPIVRHREAAGAMSPSSVQRQWPPYPGARGRPVSEMKINGVRTQSEEWEASTGPGQILDYYRQQMSARGWTDVTVEQLGIGEPGSSMTQRLEDPEFMQQLVQKVENSLVLQRDAWTLRILVGEGSRPWKTSARLFAAESSDLASILGMAGSSSGSSTFVAEEKSGDITYRTRVSQSGKAPRDAVADSMKSLGVPRWQVLAPPGRPANGVTAVGRGKDRSGQVYVFARDNRERRGTEVVTTEVIPNE